MVAFDLSESVAAAVHVPMSIGQGVGGGMEAANDDRTTTMCWNSNIPAYNGGGDGCNFGWFGGGGGGGGVGPLHPTSSQSITTASITTPSSSTATSDDINVWSTTNLKNLLFNSFGSGGNNSNCC